LRIALPVSVSLDHVIEVTRPPFACGLLLLRRSARPIVMGPSMGDGMLKLVLGVTGAALIAAAIVSAPALRSSVELGTPARKGDRLELTARVAHDPPRAWPYDPAYLQHAGKLVRLVTTDNL
jgi:alpha-beta hydrolase superfamily lysophospholipase